MIIGDYVGRSRVSGRSTNITPARRTRRHLGA
jgi:hypothetical protein